MRRTFLQPRHLLLLIFLAALVAFVALAALTDGGDVPLDQRVRAWTVAHQRQPYVYFAGLLHYAGIWWLVAIVVAFIAIVLWANGRRVAARYLALTMMLSFSLNLLLKISFRRATPGGIALGDASLFSFPSGHTMTATAFGTALAVIAWPTAWRWPAVVGAFVFAVTMGASRVYIGAHWTSDVTAGWALGVVVAVGVHTAMVWAAEIKEKPEKHPIDVVFLDWGGTLMVDDGTQTGPMVTWPRVAAMAGARQALARLHADYRLIVATNADDSTAVDVLAALRRVRLDEFIDGVVTSREVGARKPDALFYRAALLHAGFAGLPLAPLRAVMVGDAPVNDIAGAQAAGMRAVWLDAKRPTGLGNGRPGGSGGAGRADASAGTGGAQGASGAGGAASGGAEDATGEAAQRERAAPAPARQPPALPLAALAAPTEVLRIEALRELPGALKRLGGPLRGKDRAAAHATPAAPSAAAPGATAAAAPR